MRPSLLSSALLLTLLVLALPLLPLQAHSQQTPTARIDYYAVNRSAEAEVRLPNIVTSFPIKFILSIVFLGKERNMTEISSNISLGPPLFYPDDRNATENMTLCWYVSNNTIGGTLNITVSNRNGTITIKDAGINGRFNTTTLTIVIEGTANATGNYTKIFDNMSKTDVQNIFMINNKLLNMNITNVTITPETGGLFKFTIVLYSEGNFTLLQMAEGCLTAYLGINESGLGAGLNMKVYRDLSSNANILALQAIREASNTSVGGPLGSVTIPVNQTLLEFALRNLVLTPPTRFSLYTTAEGDIWMILPRVTVSGPSSEGEVLHIMARGLISFLSPDVPVLLVVHSDSTVKQLNTTLGSLLNISISSLVGNESGTTSPSGTGTRTPQVSWQPKGEEGTSFWPPPVQNLNISGRKKDLDLLIVGGIILAVALLFTILRFR